jgi:uncharacterized membrane protein
MDKNKQNKDIKKEDKELKKGLQGKDYNLKMEFKRDWFLLVIIALTFIISIIVYPDLPERVAMHWNLEGEVDNYTGKFQGAFMLPLMLLGIYLLMLVTPLIDPRKKNYPKFIGSYRLIRMVIILFLAGLHILVLLYNLGYQVDIGKVVTLGLGILFVIIGNYLPKIRHNYFLGIKVPWTLASEKVWKKTHRLGGKFFLLSGILIMMSTFLSDRPRFWIVMIAVFGTVIINTVYSYLIYKKEERG